MAAERNKWVKGGVQGGMKAIVGRVQQMIRGEMQSLNARLDRLEEARMKPPQVNGGCGRHGRERRNDCYVRVDDDGLLGSYWSHRSGDRDRRRKNERIVENDYCVGRVEKNYMGSHRSNKRGVEACDSRREKQEKRRDIDELSSVGEYSLQVSTEVFSVEMKELPIRLCGVVSVGGQVSDGDLLFRLALKSRSAYVGMIKFNYVKRVPCDLRVPELLCLDFVDVFVVSSQLSNHVGCLGPGLVVFGQEGLFASLGGYTILANEFACWNSSLVLKDFEFTLPGFIPLRLVSFEFVAFRRVIHPLGCDVLILACPSLGVPLFVLAI
ncbi:hypothetical protein Dimus_018597 [Dionaea muscipula]